MQRNKETDKGFAVAIGRVFKEYNYQTYFSAGVQICSACAGG